jgi:hypothetical protein
MMIRTFGAVYGFVFMLAYLTLAGWGLSAYRLLHLEWLALLPGLGVAAWIAQTQAGSWARLREQIAEPLTFRPTLIVLATILLACVLYPPTMLDSLTYRLPRLLLWNQYGSIYYIPTNEDRLNYVGHVWSLCTLPMVQLFGISIAWFWNVLAWLVCLNIFYAWSAALTDSPAKARQMAFLAGTSTFALLQAASTANDLFAATCILCSLYFITLYESERNPAHIFWAAISLGLTAGIKAHFTTLALPFLIWFVFAPSRPWRRLPWQWSPLLAVILFFCSPIPSFVMNARHFGSIMGPVTEHSYSGKSPALNVALGGAMMVFQNLQPAIDPLALLLDKRIESIVTATGIRDLAPRFNLRMQPISLVDGASLGLLTTTLLAAGIWLAFRRNPALAKSWPRWALAAGFIGFACASAKVLPAAIGRSSAGFLYLCVPLALLGWATFSSRTLSIATTLTLAGSLLALIFTPERPLWPVSSAYACVSHFGWSAATRQLRLYGLIAQRRHVGGDLMEAVPADETRVYALVAEDQPLLSLLWPPRHFKVDFLDDSTTLDEFKRRAPNTVLISGGADRAFPALIQYLEQSGEFERIRSREYVAKLSVGPETWSLYHRKSTNLVLRQSAAPTMRTP